MTIVSRRIVTPHPGRFDTVIERLRIGEGALQRAGGDTLLMKITYGQMAGSIALFGLFDAFKKTGNKRRIARYLTGNPLGANKSSRLIARKIKLIKLTK